MLFKITFREKMPSFKQWSQYDISVARDALMSRYSCPTSWGLIHNDSTSEQMVGFTCISDDPGTNVMDIKDWIKNLPGTDKCSIVDNLSSTGDIILTT